MLRGMSTVSTMQVNRGAVILCDHLDQMANGKWLIAGTYTRLLANQPNCHFATGLAIYLRFQVEQIGTYDVTVKLILLDKSPTSPPVIRNDFKATVSDVHHPVELGIRTPAFTVHYPGDFAALQPGQSVPVRFAIWAEVGGCELASTPLTVVFSKPA
jgi:hypothetical protein